MNRSWSSVFFYCAIAGIIFGYILALIYRPGLIPPMLRFGGMVTPTTVMLLGTDVVYSRQGRYNKADQTAFSGRSDTILVARLDPIRNMLTVVSIPRDTTVSIPGYGRQKINAANALGGPRLTAQTINSFMGVSIDHYAVLNVRGLVELVDELGGVSVEIPKKMRYVDHSAKLDIDLEPGMHTLTGIEAMGFVRFRHDVLGDIGRVQRQEIFLKALLQKALNPESWSKLPTLLKIAQRYIYTDMSYGQIAQIVSFARAVPKENQRMLMLPGHFSGTGDWAADEEDLQCAQAALSGRSMPVSGRSGVQVSIENASTDATLASRLQKRLQAMGYSIVSVKGHSDVLGAPLAHSRIIAERGNGEEATMMKHDLGGAGEVIFASVGDIQSSLTLIAGNDLLNIKAPPPSRNSHRRYH